MNSLQSAALSSAVVVPFGNADQRLTPERLSLLTPWPDDLETEATTPGAPEAVLRGINETLFTLASDFAKRHAVVSRLPELSELRCWVTVRLDVFSTGHGVGLTRSLADKPYRETADLVTGVRSLIEALTRVVESALSIDGGDAGLAVRLWEIRQAYSCLDQAARSDVLRRARETRDLDTLRALAFAPVVYAQEDRGVAWAALVAALVPGETRRLERAKRADDRLLANVASVRDLVERVCGPTIHELENIHA